MNIQTILNHAKTLNHAERQTYKTALFEAAGQINTPKPVRRYRRGIGFPQIGGADVVVAPNPYIDTPPFQDRWAPSGVTVWIYALGCEGTFDLARLLNLPIFKVGSTEGDIRVRMRELGRDQYGSMWRGANALMIDRGFRTWIAEHLPVTLPLSPASPVKPGVRSIGVHLPLGMTPKQFDVLLALEVQKAALATLAKSDAGREFCKALGLDPMRLLRLTSYEFGPGARISTAGEFAIFRPRAEADRLAVIAEKIVVDFVMKKAD